jgi:hypothetical protein
MVAGVGGKPKACSTAALSVDLESFISTLESVAHVP